MVSEDLLRALRLALLAEELESRENRSEHPRADASGGVRPPVGSSRLVRVDSEGPYRVRLDGPGRLVEAHLVADMEFFMRLDVDGYLFVAGEAKELEGQSFYSEFLSVYRRSDGWHLVLRGLGFLERLDLAVEDTRIRGYIRWERYPGGGAG